MKITQTSDEYQNKQSLRHNALKGCNKCPCCGETKSYLRYIAEGIADKGINSGICRTWYGKLDEENSSIFSILNSHRNKHWKVECFTCYTCGAKWESEPYEY